MKLTCPVCGAVASAEAWENDAQWREMMRVVLSLPAPVATVSLGYFSLFRPGKSALSVKKALRLAKEIAALVAPEYVRVQGKPARRCYPATWAQAMELMSERRGSLQLPLKNHNYLRQIAWGLADAEDAANEARRREMEAAGNYRGAVPHPAAGNPLPAGDGVDDGLLPIERAMRSKQ